MAELQKEEPKEKMFTLSFTKEEILERIKTLSNSENVSLHLRVQKGQEELEEMNQLLQMIQPYLNK